MLKEPVVFGIVVAGFFSIGTVIGLSIFIPLYIELVLGASASAAGVVLIAFMARRDARLDGGRPLYDAPRSLQARADPRPCRSPIAALIVFALLPADLTVVQVAALLAVGGAGIGPMWPTTTVIIQNAVPLHQLGIATGTLSFFRQLGGAVIVAVFAAIVLGGQRGPHARQALGRRRCGGRRSQRPSAGCSSRRRSFSRSR